MQITITNANLIGAQQILSRWIDAEIEDQRTTQRVARLLLAVQGEIRALVHALGGSDEVPPSLLAAEIEMEIPTRITIEEIEASPELRLGGREMVTMLPFIAPEPAA